MAMNNQPLLASITQNPLLISQTAQQLFQDSITHVVGHEHATDMLAMAASADDDFWPTDSNDWRAAYRPYNVQAGTLQIPVMGVLLHRFPYQLGRWATGYAYIEKALERGLADSNVKRIAFVHDSPGGEVAGCFELADKIYAARAQKPSWAFAADNSYSASYALGSAAGGYSVTRSGGVGSIGVVTAHVSYASMLEKVGIEVTFIFAGKHKVDGNAYEKLPDAVKARIQKRIDRTYGEFTSTVARNRGMEEQAVRDTEALTYSAAEAIEIGLADRTGALEDEMTIFSEAEAEDDQMANNNTLNTTSGADAVDKATHDAAVATARTEGATAERARVSAILASDEGKKRPKAAMSLAMRSAMSVDEASAALADMNEETAVAPKADDKATGDDKTKTKTKATTDALAASMTATGGGTGVGSDPDDEDETETDDEQASASILSAYAGVSGRSKKKS